MNFLTAFSMSPWCHGNREGRSSTMPCSTTFVARGILSQASDGDDLKARLSATFPDCGGRVCPIKIRKSYKSESHILTSRPNALNN